MRSLVLAALVCVALSLTSQEAIEQINKIDQTPFGHTLFETIFMSLDSGDPLDTLLETLASLEDQLVAEQKEDDAENRSFQDGCDQDIHRLDQDLADSTTYRVQLEAKLEGQLYPQQQIVSNLKNQKGKEIAGIQKDIDELDATRAEEKEEFEQKVNEHNEASQIITEARRLFEGLLSEGTFLQKPSSNGKVTLNKQGLAMIQKNLKEGIHKMHKFTHRKSYGGLVKIFATITSQAQQLADAGHLQRIIDLADALLQKIEDSLDLERKAEDARVDSYKKARKLLSITLQNANTVFANLSVELSSIEDAIARTETAHENVSQRIANLTEERGDRWAVCEEAAADYSSARAVRDDRRNTISQALAIINAQLRTLREQLALRLAAGDNI